MKKVIFLLFISVLSAYSQKMSDSRFTMKAGIKNELDSASDFCTNNIVIIDQSSFETADALNLWLRDNDDLICTYSINSIGCANRLAISLLEFDSKETQAVWLGLNTSHICIQESLPFIERTNRINQTRSHIDDDIRAAQNYSYTIEEFKSALKSISPNPIDIDNPNSWNFNTFLKLSIKSGSLKLESDTKYDPSFTTYSIPFLKSIIDTNTTGKTISFAQVKFNGRDIIAFNYEFKNAAGNIFHRYYDYSTRPGFSLFAMKKTGKNISAGRGAGKTKSKKI